MRDLSKSPTVIPIQAVRQATVPEPKDSVSPHHYIVTTTTIIVVIIFIIYESGNTILCNRVLCRFDLVPTHWYNKSQSYILFNGPTANDFLFKSLFLFLS
jgi:hypothetical protein